MAYIAGVQAYGSDSSTDEGDGGQAAQDPGTPALVPLVGLGLEATRQWLSGLEVSPRGATPAAQINDVPCLTQTVTIIDTNGTHVLEFTAGLLTGYTLTPP